MYSCASMAMPSGGPKDVTPPKELKSIPPNYSRNFNQKKVRIFFDEFVKLQDVNNQVIISPPLEEMPEFNLRGKSVVIEFEEEFKENTTYTVFFGNAIADITENNTMLNFEYVFSTGNTIDSLSIKGWVVNAFNSQPEKDVFVMLYLQTYDSVPYKEKPYYLTRTNESGEFALNNLGEGQYKVFALRDANSNFLYDLPNEEIAFSDSLIEPEYYRVFQNDSIITDSLANEEIIIDTIEPPLYKLYLFEEPATLQRLVRAYSPLEAMMEFIFLKPMANPEIRVLNHEFISSWYIEDFNSTNDTLTYWITNPEKDTLIIEVSDGGVIMDTAEIIISKPEEGKRLLRKRENDQPERLVVKSNTGGTFDYFRQLYLSSSYPLETVDFSRILLIEEMDTLNPDISFTDEIKTKLKVDHEFKENTYYQIFFPDSVFTDIIGKSNDTTNISFKTNSIDDFGTLFLKLRLPDSNDQYIIQLLDEKEKVLRQQTVTTSTEIHYNHLKPAKYIIKAVLDKNKNGKWDTGNYLNNIQPEMVYFFPSKISIRSKWEIEEEWKL